MPRPALEVADIFRDHGAAWRRANARHVSLDQLKVMSAIERCRTVALVGLQPTGLTRGGHVARCEDCADTVIAYNSCRDRHCPKGRRAAAKQWLTEREAELLPVSYFHLVFTLPGPIADIAYHNKATIYGLLFTAAAEATMTIAARLRHLSRAAAQGRVGGLRQETVRPAAGRARVSVALHPPPRHLQSPTDLSRRDQRLVQVEGLPDRGP